MNDHRIERADSSFATGIMDAARENPVAASVLGMGVVWLVSSMVPRRERNSGASVGSRLRHAPDAARETLAAAGSTMADSASAAGHYISDVTKTARRQFNDLSDASVRRVRDAAADASLQAGELKDASARTMSNLGDAAGALRQQAMEDVFDIFRTAREKIGALVEEQPLLLAAGGLMVGAAIAASIPTTDVERRTLGETGKGLTDAAGEWVDQAASRLSDAATAASREARRQGLTADALGDQAASFAERARSVVSGADVNLAPRQGSQLPSGSPI
jgi:hypothetical protein